MKLMICGHGRHGKDTVAEILRDDFGVSFQSSSLAAAAHVWPMLANKDDYATVEECYQDRANHRQAWYEVIKELNREDKTWLMKQIYRINDVYVGIRDREEFIAGRHRNVFQFSVWVDASDRVPPEPTTSNTVTRDLCDIIIDNNADLPTLKFRVGNFAQGLCKSMCSHQFVYDACRQGLMCSCCDLFVSDRDYLNVRQPVR